MGLPGHSRRLLPALAMLMVALGAACGVERDESEQTAPPSRTSQQQRTTGTSDDAPAPEATQGAPRPADNVGNAPAPEAAATGEGECADAATCHAMAASAERAGHAQQAVSGYERACGFGGGPACARLGELYRDGIGVRADEARAEDLFNQGCRLGSQRACDAMGH